MKPKNDTQEEFSIISRFFENQIPRYIILVIDSEPLAQQLILNIRKELKVRGKEIGHLKLGENEISIYSQIERFLSESPCNGLLLSGMDLLILQNSQETLSKLNKARDAFEKFRLPIAFIVNNDSLKKIIRIASDFYQLRDLPDFHFTGTVEEKKEIIEIDDSITELYPDEDLKIELLEEQLLLLEKEQGLNEDSLNHTVIPLLKIYVNRRNSKRAEEIFDRYIRGRESQVKDKLALGDFHSLLYHYKEALEYFHEAIETSERISDKEGVSILFKRIGRVYRRMAEYDSALEYYRKALEIDREIKKIEGEALALHEIGRIFESKGQYNKALDYIQKGLEIYKKTGGNIEKGRILNDIGYIYYLKGQSEQALDYFQKALVISKKLIGKCSFDMSVSYNNIFLVYSRMGQFVEALEYQQKALQIQEKILYKCHPRLAASYNDLSMLYLRMGQFEKALTYQRKALEIREKVLPKMHPYMALSYNNLATIYLSLGQLNLALDYQQKAMHIREKILDREHPDLASSYSIMSSIYRNMGQKDKASEYAEKAAAIMKKISVQPHANLENIDGT